MADFDFPGNAYPNPDNFPEVSFPQELTPPDEEADEPDLNILVQYNPAWTAVLMAACDQLLQYSSWEGTHDDKIQAVNRATELKWLLQHPVHVGEENYPAPFWDDETSEDDEAPFEIQEWYGEVEDSDAPAGELTFVQNAVIWLLTGFVAIASAPTIVGGAAAAIFFRTVAVRFTLAWDRGDIGEIFRVVIDSVDYATIDTSDADVGDIIELDVDGLEDLPEHEILIIKTG